MTEQPADTPAPPRDLPEDFLWGSSTSAHQVEGGNSNSDWWAFEHAEGSPVTEPSGLGIDQWTRYQDDFRLLADLGQNAHRLSVEWARFEPRPGEWCLDVVEHYRSVLGTLVDLGITPVVTLHHFTLPRWFADGGGWLAPEALEAFRRYVSGIARDLGDLIPYACTINEPQIVALYGYLLGQHPPRHRDPEEWKRAGRRLLAAHRTAVGELRAVRGDGIRAGLALQLPVLEALPDDPASAAITAEVTGEMIDLYVDGLTDDERAGEFVGLNYYTRVRPDPSRPGLIAPPPAGSEVTQMGWEVYPDGLRQMLHVAAGTGLPVVVTESGIATADDAQRVDYLDAHLGALLAGIDEGADVRGFFCWSSFDNFEWLRGYTPTFGLVGIDRDDDLRRVPRPSAHAYGRVCRSGRVAALREG